MTTDAPPAARLVAGRYLDPDRRDHRYRRKGDRLIRWGTALSVVVVTGIAAVISYGHAYQLVTRYGEAGPTARALPLTVDGLIATCSLIILDCTRRERPVPWHAWGLLAVGVCATVGANVAHGIDHGIVGAIVAGWPALVAVGTFELMIRLLRDGRPTHALTHDLNISARTCPEFDVLDRGPVPEPAVLAAAERYADDLAQGRVPSIRRLKRELRVGHPRASRIHDALAARATASAVAT